MRTFKFSQTKFVSKSYRFFDGEGDAGGDATGDAGGGGDAGAGTGSTGTGTGTGGAANSGRVGKVFTQAEVDRIVKNDKDKAKRERDQLVTQLEGLKAQGLTQENIDGLNDRIEQLQNEGKTTAQLANEDKVKLEKKLTGEVTKKEAEAKGWKGKYETYRTQNEILTAANANKAHNPEQVYNILRSDTTMVEILGEDGKPTGEYEPRVKFRDTKDGQSIVLDLTIPAAIKRMTELETHQNLFESGATSGLGGRNNGRAVGKGGTAVPTDTKAYMEARKKNPNLIREGTKA